MQVTQPTTQLNLSSNMTTPAANSNIRTSQNLNKSMNASKPPSKPPVGNYKNWKKRQEETRDPVKSSRQTGTAHRRGKSETKTSRGTLNKTTLNMKAKLQVCKILQLA